MSWPSVEIERCDNGYIVRHTTYASDYIYISPTLTDALAKAAEVLDYQAEIEITTPDKEPRRADG